MITPRKRHADDVARLEHEIDTIYKKIRWLTARITNLEKDDFDHEIDYFQSRRKNRR